METVSKRAKKRAEKRELMLQTRSEWRKAEKLKKRQKKQLRISMGLPARDISKNMNKRMSESDCRIHVAIDMSFDHLMSDKEIRQAQTQLQYAYSVNRRSSNPLQLYFTSFTGPSRQIFDQTLGTQNWDVHVKECSYRELLDPARAEVVYLTSESPNVLDVLDDKHLYVIGGLVDHNSHKGLCYQNAIRDGIAHSQLPIGEFLDMKTRKVLTINHVFEILLHWTETKDWEKAFLKVIPSRKGAMGLARAGASAGSAETLSDDGSLCSSIAVDLDTDAVGDYQLLDVPHTECDINETVESCAAATAGSICEERKTRDDIDVNLEDSDRRFIEVSAGVSN